MALLVKKKDLFSVDEDSSGEMTDNSFDEKKKTTLTVDWD
jgi:hypothetical protein